MGFRPPQAGPPIFGGSPRRRAFLFFPAACSAVPIRSAHSGVLTSEVCRMVARRMYDIGCRRVAKRPSTAGQGIVPALRSQLRISRKLSTLGKACSRMILLQRRRMGSGDLPGLQSRRSGPSRAEWWIRLPHASAISEHKIKTKRKSGQESRA